jgi:hypothetical protein
MEFKTGLLGLALLMFVALGRANELSYEDSITALASGNVVAQPSFQPSAEPGEVWLNVSGFAPEKLPNIQRDVGMASFDNAVPLEIVAGLTKIAAIKSQWGDIVFLYNVFSMNAFPAYVNVSSREMKYGLLRAVTGEHNGEVNTTLVDLYARTSSSVYLSDAFKNLKTEPRTLFNTPARKVFAWIYCDNQNMASTTDCLSVIQRVTGVYTWKSGGPRSICEDGCCISWSADATFQWDNLNEAANLCMKVCAELFSISCKVLGVNLQGTSVTQCLSNRATGCT